MVLARLPLRAVVALPHRPRVNLGALSKAALSITSARAHNTRELQDASFVERTAALLVLLPFTSYSENRAQKLQRQARISSQIEKPSLMKPRSPVVISHLGSKSQPIRGWCDYAFHPRNHRIASRLG